MAATTPTDPPVNLKEVLHSLEDNAENSYTTCIELLKIRTLIEINDCLKDLVEMYATVNHLREK